MISHSPLGSRWWLLLGALGMLGCITGPDPQDDAPVEVDESLSILGRVCGGPFGLTCRKTDYCATPANTCPGPKQSGVCRPRPAQRRPAGTDRRQPRGGHPGPGQGAPDLPPPAGPAP